MRAVHFRVDRGDDLKALLARHGVGPSEGGTITRGDP
jgi:hypothetical protein